MCSDPKTLTKNTTFKVVGGGRILSFVTSGEESKMRLLLSEDGNTLSVYISQKGGGTFKYKLIKVSWLTPIFDAVSKMLNGENLSKDELERVSKNIISKSICRGCESYLFSNHLVLKIRKNIDIIQISITNAFRINSKIKRLGCKFCIKQNELTSPLFNAIINL